MGNKTKSFINKKRKRRNLESMERARAKRQCKENSSDKAIADLVGCEHQNEEEPFEITSAMPNEINMVVEGRRIIDFQYFFDQIKIINNHCEAMGCTIDNLQLIKEYKTGLKSIFITKCNMCNLEFQLLSSKSSNSDMDINCGAVTGAMLTGFGRSNLNELLASMNLPIFTQNIYSKCHDQVAKWWKEAAEESMQEAAKEEAAEAISCGEMKDGIPVLTVIADCCWSKRSYKTNYSAMSGVAAIIGYKSGKVLYMDVKNKYCVMCARAAVKGEPPANHECYKNHTGSSTSMEQSVIVEGFKTSIARQNVIYGTLIADGDASTFKKILESRPYPNYQVNKIECTNHLLRNYCGKILNVSKDTSIPSNERKLLTVDRQKRLRTAIKCAMRFRKAQNLTHTEQIINLKKDILNSPKHIFGDHSACENYYCTRKDEENVGPKVQNLLQKIMGHTAQIAFHSKSLLHNVNNNRAEQFNSIVAKLVRGKRVNFSLKNSYTARCHAAVVSFNSARPQYAIYKSKFYKSPGRSLKLIEMARLKRKQKGSTFRRPRRRLNFENDKTHYGQECQRPDMSADDYSIAMNLFLQNLQEQVNNREEVERSTILQAESALWLELRRCLVTASSFGKVCKRRQNISSAPLVRSHLYSYSLDNIKSIEHGKNNEVIAIRQLENQQNIIIQKCGLFIDEKFFFLGASPDGIFEEGIIEIKCPISAFGMNAEDAVKDKKIKFWNSDGTINRRHEWFYQIQGQLHIAKKNLCLFAVWTGIEFPMKIEKIIRDDDFWQNQMETRIVNYYNKCLLPEIVDPRKSRSMPLRSLTIACENAPTRTHSLVRVSKVY
ncbi:hypothetical protein ACJJTC_018073 [Scirpophaga incertulas]